MMKNWYPICPIGHQQKWPSTSVNNIDIATVSAYLGHSDVCNVGDQNGQTRHQHLKVVTNTDVAVTQFGTLE